MIYTFTVHSSEGLHKPSRFACTTLSTDVQETAALSLTPMLDGSIRAQSLDFSITTVSMSGSGFVAPHVDDIPLSELLELHAANQVSSIVPDTVTVGTVSAVDGMEAPEGYRWLRVSLADFVDAIPSRTELHYEPIFSALYATEDEDGEEVLDVYEGENFRDGDTLSALVPVAYEQLRVSYFPIYQCYLTQPCKVSTDNNDGNVSWSMEFVVPMVRSEA